MKKLFIALLLLSFAIVPFSHASVGVKNTGTMKGGAIDLNFNNPPNDSYDGSTYTHDCSFFATSDYGGASSTLASSSTQLGITNVPYFTVYKATGGANSLDISPGTTLQNGTPGQILVLNLQQVGTSGSWNIYPANLNSDFVSINMATKNNSVTLWYVSATQGWRIISVNGATYVRNVTGL